VNLFAIRIQFHGDLGLFLDRRRAQDIVERQLSERTSVKDAIEACGVPHPEVDLILVDGRPVDFAYILERSHEIDVYPVQFDRTFFQENRLQSTRHNRFIADCHLGKLVRNLRLLGIDVAYDPTAYDRQLLRQAKTDNRALLTRDRRLLMHAVVRDGYYLRSQDPLEQTIEVLRRFDLLATQAPFTRCSRCNALLEPVEKAEIIEQLEPLTKIYYEQFRRCTGCGQIYWPGSHFEKLEARIAALRKRYWHLPC
jgi:uncharacterized protein with PIN domain